MFCVIINNSTYCRDATCVCKRRVKRGINIDVDEAKKNKDGDQLPKSEEPTCEFTNIQEKFCPKTNSQEFPTEKTDLENGTMNTTQVTNLENDLKKESYLEYAKDKGKHNVFISSKFERVYNAHKYLTLLRQFI